jgi:hypothetical protein
MKFTKVLASAILATTLLAPTAASAATPLWDNPTEYYSLPNGTHDSNKSERLSKGHTYHVSFDAQTYGENVLLVYAQNRNYLDEFIPLTGEWQHFEYTIAPKTDTHVVFEDLQSLGDINIRNIQIVEE